MAEARKESNDPQLNQGLPDHRGIDDAGRDRILQQLEPRTDNVVGNFADLQRMGGAIVEGNGSVEEAVATPPDVDTDTANFPTDDASKAETLRTLADEVEAEENEKADNAGNGAVANNSQQSQNNG